MKLFFLLLSVLSIAFSVQRTEERMIVDLRGNWKFQIGDKREYADPNFNDAKWEQIFVPSDWENEGFPGYDGYAWYRRSFTLPANATDKRLSLRMGFVDDVCAVYVNGTLIGEGGRFPPDYQTAYDQEQIYILPKELLKSGKENVIAVRLYDDMQSGGIVRGRIGIVERTSPIPLVVELADRWKFRTGDEENWKDVSFNDKGWADITVPAKWDFQGYRDYDGIAWYRTTFDLPANANTDDLTLVLGRIDDLDETFLNGERIGRTGRIRHEGTRMSNDEDYRKFRAYEIPKSLLKPKGNVIAVRVYDGLKDGGIYEGPIGIVSGRDITKWRRATGQDRWRSGSTLDRILEDMFR